MADSSRDGQEVSARGAAAVLAVLGVAAIAAGFFFDGWGWLIIVGVLSLVGAARARNETSSATAAASGDSFRAATALLGVESRSGSVDALRSLVDQSNDDLLALAKAESDGAEVLLAVTRDRIARVEGTRVREWPRSAVAHLDVDGAGRKTAVAVTLPRETLRFARVRPEAAAGRVVAVLRDAASSPPEPP